MGWFGKKAEVKRNAVTEPLATTRRSPYNANLPVDSVASANNYVAPNLNPPASPMQSAAVPQSPVSHSPVDLDEEEMVVVDKHHETEEDYGEVENPSSTSYSRAGESEPEPSSYANNSSKQNHLNSLFNGHLMKWKFEAEEGTSFLRVPACKFRRFRN